MKLLKENENMLNENSSNFMVALSEFKKKSVICTHFLIIHMVQSNLFENRKLTPFFCEFLVFWKIKTFFFTFQPIQDSRSIQSAHCCESSVSSRKNRAREKQRIH